MEHHLIPPYEEWETQEQWIELVKCCFDDNNYPIHECIKNPLDGGYLAKCNIYKYILAIQNCTSEEFEYDVKILLNSI